MPVERLTCDDLDRLVAEKVMQEQQPRLYSTHPLACADVKRRLLWDGREDYYHTAGPTSIAVTGVHVSVYEKNGTLLKWRVVLNNEEEDAEISGEGATEEAAWCYFALACHEAGLLPRRRS